MPLPSMCTVVRAALPALVALSVSLAPTLAAQGDIFTRIEDRTQQVRQLDLKEPIEITFLTREELRAEIATDEYPLEEQSRDLRVLVAFGLVSPDLNLGDLYNELYGEGVLGYYDPNTKRMVVVSNSGEPTELAASEELTFAHETVHALQDQHFDLVSLQDRANAADSDMSLALIALPEGDATFFEQLYATSDPDFLKRLIDEYQTMELPDILQTAPPIFIDTLYFPYDQGGTFVNAIYQEGGWSAVDAVYASPPVSTEQVLHPDKYRAGEKPVPVTIGDPSSALGAGWSVLDTDTFGEFQIGIILNTTDNISDDEAADAAAGWGGDRYVVVGNADQTAIAWQTTWDSENDAQEFAKAMADREADRLRVDASELDGGVGYAFATDGEVVQILVDGEDVTYLSAPDATTLATVQRSALDPDATPAVPAGPATPVAATRHD